MSSKSYSSSPPFAEAMSVSAGSFMNTMMCGSSSAAPSRMAARGGRRDSTVPSVARTGVAGALGPVVALEVELADEAAPHRARGQRALYII